MRARRDAVVRLARISRSWVSESAFMDKRKRSTRATTTAGGAVRLVKPVLTMVVSDRFWSGRCGGIFPTRPHGF